MSQAERYLLSVLRGEARGAAPSILRGAAAAAEPLYAGAMSLRNRLYDQRLLPIRQLPRPVVSVGNLTAGGTGKTPVVSWLARRFIGGGVLPAILLRGYRKHGSADSDEAAMLAEQLPDAVVRADPNRYAAGRSVLAEYSDIGVFILDDGFQHRRLARDFDLLLVSALDPFGLGHVHPRGLLREPASGLRRASAVLITHTEAVSPDALRTLEEQLATLSDAPLYHAVHRIHGFVEDDEVLPTSVGSSRPCFLVSGIGSPVALEKQVREMGMNVRGALAFADHHAYTRDDAAQIGHAARQQGAEVILTTEKDWVKLRPLAAGLGLKIWRTMLSIEFARPGDEGALFSRIQEVVSRAAASERSTGAVEGDGTSLGRVR